MELVRFDGVEWISCHFVISKLVFSQPWM
ncbi:hypothetical protein TpMuguga_04g00581 [Theileria parva strain Muguga]|uniref:Uncharacterized protein n=1 Tax=Theileria parva TaxID=5875 RepID=Q4N1Z6_THEPA|nr:hypothetical protein TpMuguga_04g00581 [Theileria parva strain Muguga]